MMSVHTSAREPEPVYAPDFKPKYWGETLQSLALRSRYFYSLDGQ